MTDFSKHEGVDPYRYGPPAPVDARAQHPTGKQILRSSWHLLKQDRELIALPLLGAVFGVIAFCAFFVPGLLIGLGTTDARVPAGVGAVVGGFAASIIAIFFQAALVAGAYQRADGDDPTIGTALAAAWRLRRQVFGWAVLTTVVGTVIRAVEERLGILGKIVGFLGGVAWAVASFFAVPALVAEGLGPIDALKRSTATIREVWGTSVRTTLRFGFIQLALTIVPMIVLFAGVMIAMGGGGSGATVAGVLLALVGGLALMALGLVFGAISTYARGLIFRWSTGRPVPGIDPALFAGAFRARRGRKRWA